jgi:hypothetical protein
MCVKCTEADGSRDAESAVRDTTADPAKRSLVDAKEGAIVAVVEHQRAQPC